MTGSGIRCRCSPHERALLPLIGVFDATATFMSGGPLRRRRGRSRCSIASRTTISFATFPAVSQALLHHPDYHRDRWRHIRSGQQCRATGHRCAGCRSRCPTRSRSARTAQPSAAGWVAFNDPSDTLDQRCTTSGRPFDGIELEIRDLDTGDPVGPGCRGEDPRPRGTACSTATTKDPVRTAEAIDADGWFHTGDIGALSAEGRISYLGRAKDMLKVGGRERRRSGDRVVSGHASGRSRSRRSSAFRIPSTSRFRRRSSSWRRAIPSTPEEMIAFCRGGLAAFKVPRHVRFITQWPMSATKIQKIPASAATRCGVRVGSDQPLTQLSTVVGSSRCSVISAVSASGASCGIRVSDPFEFDESRTQG